MKINIATLAAAVVLFLLTGTATAQDPTPSPEPATADTVAKGVNPADNITKVEILPRFQVIDDGVSILSTTIKYDRSLNAKWAMNVEAPILRFHSPLGSDTGVGDVAVRVKYQTQAADRITIVAGAEAIIPTATADSLGSGKLQLNPSVAAVYQISPNIFAAGAVKQIFSVAGKSRRPDLIQGQYRLLTGYISKKGWWVLADPQLWADFKNGNRVEFAPEFEVGRMVGPTTGIWFRSGGHVAGGWNRQDWNIGGGIRFIFF